MEKNTYLVEANIRIGQHTTREKCLVLADSIMGARALADVYFGKGEHITLFVSSIKLVTPNEA